MARKLSAKSGASLSAIAATEAVRPPVEARGEISLELGGMTMVLRPSYEAIEAFELATGKGLLDIARDGLAGKLTVGETAQVACECIKAWGRDTGSTSATHANARKVAELMLDSPGGFRECLNILAGMLAMAVTGGYTSKGEIRPATTTE